MQLIRRLMDQRGAMSLMELTAALAVSAIVLVPLTSIMAVQVRTPVKVVSEVTTKRQLQKASLVITEDASAAETFEFGTEPDYGTFIWEELSSGDPVPVTVRYFFESTIDVESKRESGTLLRDVIRGGQQLAPKIWIEGVAKFDDVVFQYTAPQWAFGDISRDWALDDGKITVTIRQTVEAGAEFGDTVTSETMTAHLRPDITRPVSQPSP